MSKEIVEMMMTCSHSSLSRTWFHLFSCSYKIKYGMIDENLSLMPNAGSGFAAQCWKAQCSCSHSPGELIQWTQSKRVPGAALLRARTILAGSASTWDVTCVSKHMAWPWSDVEGKSNFSLLILIHSPIECNLHIFQINFHLCRFLLPCLILCWTTPVFLGLN